MWRSSSESIDGRRDNSPQEDLNMARRLPPKPGRGRGPARAAAPQPRRPRPVAGRPALAAVKPTPVSQHKTRAAAATSPSGEAHGAERLQKVLAAAGFGSRRACEELIVQGRVVVNDAIIRELGTKVEPDAKIEVDGQRIHREKLVYLLVHKPRGYVSSNTDPSGRPLVVDLVKVVPERVYTVGRLDEDSTGLMILTNDGELANKLAHPRYGVEKVYKAVVAGHPSPEVIAKLMEGVWLSDGKARARRVRVVGQQGDSTQIEMVLAEGKNREVRRMWAKLGHKVMRLNRVAIGPLTIKGLKPGSWRNLTAEEVSQLQQVAAGKKVPTAWFDERDLVRRESRPRRGPGRHEYEAATRKPRLAVAEGEANEGPPRPLGPRGARPSSPPRPGAPRPLGPRAERPGTAPRPVPKRPAGPGAERPAGPRAGARPGASERPAGPRGARPGADVERPAGPRGARPGPAGAAHRLGPRPHGPGPRPHGPAAGRPPRDASRIGRPDRRPSPRDEDSLEIDIEIPPAYAALPPSKRAPTGPKGPRGSSRARPRPAAELGDRKVIGLEPEGDAGPPAAGAPRRQRPAPRRARPLAKPRREKPSEPEPDSEV
jgi:23S rRNA pseudouridine2605 synthase